MDVRDLNGQRAHRFACSLGCASATAFLIQLSHGHDSLCFVSLFALVPFLWRALIVRPSVAAELGGLLAASLWLSTLISPGHEAVFSPPMQLLTSCLVFTAFAVSVNLLKRRLGLNIVLIAMLWLPVDLALRAVHLPVAFQPEQCDAGGILLRLSSLFGVIVVSFLVVLINAVVLFIALRAAGVLSRVSLCHSTTRQRFRRSSADVLAEGPRYGEGGSRSPPRVYYRIPDGDAREATQMKNR